MGKFLGPRGLKAKSWEYTMKAPWLGNRWVSHKLKSLIRQKREGSLDSRAARMLGSLGH